MRVAVTGGSGQLGSHVLRRLVRDPAVESVVSLDLRPPREFGAKLRHVTADVRDPDFGRHLDGCDALVHVAFVVFRKLPREVFDDINVRGSENVFRAAAHAGIRQIVYTSSVAAYGVVVGHPRPLTEDAPRVRQPEFAYGCAKYDVEAFLDRFETLHPDLRVARLRPGVLIGARIDHPGSSTLKGRLLFDVGGGPSPIVWDEDVADAVMLALHRRAHGGFNLVADDPRPARELARLAGFRHLAIPTSALRMAARAGTLFERLGLGDAIDPAWMSVSTDMLVSNEKARSELGWNPTCPTSLAVLRRFDAETPRWLDPRIGAIVRIASPTHGEKARARYHLLLTGPEGGDLTLAIVDGGVRLARGVPRPPDGRITLAARTFVDMLSGYEDTSEQVARGAIVLEGDVSGETALETFVRDFTTGVRAGGPRAWAERALRRVI